MAAISLSDLTAMRSGDTLRNSATVIIDHRIHLGYIIQVHGSMRTPLPTALDCVGSAVVVFLTPDAMPRLVESEETHVEIMSSAIGMYACGTARIQEIDAPLGAQFSRIDIKIDPNDYAWN